MLLGFKDFNNSQNLTILILYFIFAISVFFKKLFNDIYQDLSKIWESWIMKSKIIYLKVNQLKILLIV